MIVKIRDKSMIKRRSMIKLSYFEKKISIQLY